MLEKMMKYPIIQAPMAGGVSTALLAAEVCHAGGLGFLAGGYKTAVTLREEIQSLRTMTNAMFGVNLFVPSIDYVEEETLSIYKNQIKHEVIAIGAQIGEAKFDDDEWENKLQLMKQEKVPVVSFTFGCPTYDVIQDLQASGCFIIVTVTTPDEARVAAASGADALCVQGIEAGGHRASFHNRADVNEDYELLDLLHRIKKEIHLPLIAAGGLMNGYDVAKALLAGASAAQLGTAFLLCPESGANPTYKNALSSSRFQNTAVTRAFTGRRARGLVNEFLTKYDAAAPAAYPHIHHMTKDVRRLAAQMNQPELMSLWAGQGYQQARNVPAAELVNKLVSQVCEILESESL